MKQEEQAGLKCCLVFMSCSAEFGLYPEDFGELLNSFRQDQLMIRFTFSEHFLEAGGGKASHGARAVTDHSTVGRE